MNAPSTTAAVSHTTIDSPLGPLTAVTGPIGLRGLYLPGHRPAPTAARLGAPATGPSSYAEVADQLAAYFAGHRTVFDLALDPVGTPFQVRVWAALREVGYGTTVTYGELTAAADLPPTAVRAVAAANARNPLSIVVPCHRVIGRDGSLTGYAGGLDRKRHLLDLEAGRG